MGFSKTFEDGILKLPIGLKTAPNGTLKTPRYELFGEGISYPIVFVVEEFIKY